MSHWHLQYETSNTFLAMSQAVAYEDGQWCTLAWADPKTQIWCSNVLPNTSSLSKNDYCRDIWDNYRQPNCCKISSIKDVLPKLYITYFETREDWFQALSVAIQYLGPSLHVLIELGNLHLPLFLRRMSQLLWCLLFVIWDELFFFFLLLFYS